MYFRTLTLRTLRTLRTVRTLRTLRTQRASCGWRTSRAPRTRAHATLGRRAARREGRPSPPRTGTGRSAARSGRGPSSPGTVH